MWRSQVAGQQVTVWAESLRVKDSAKADTCQLKIAQQKATIDERIGQLDALFVQVDRAGKDESGDLTRDEVRQLLGLLGAEASDGQVDVIFRNYDSDHSGTVSRDEFEMCLPMLRSGYTSPVPFKGANHEPELTSESSSAAQERLHAGALVAAFDPTDGLWTRASVEVTSTAERRDGSVVQFVSVVYSNGESGVVYREAVRVRESEHSKISKEYHTMYDQDGDGRLGRAEVVEYLVAEGMESSDTAVDQLFECYDSDGSGTLCKDEFDTFILVASGEAEDAAIPPPGSSSDLKTVVEGSHVLAFYVADQLWYGATVLGVFAGKTQQLPDGSTVNLLYYTVRYNAYPETVEVLNDSSVRLPPRKADDDSESRYEMEQAIRMLFDSIDVSPDGALSMGEVKTLLITEGLDSSDGHVSMLFERFDADGTGAIERLEFEPFLRAIRRAKAGEAEPAEPPDGTSGDLSRLEVGNEVLAFYSPENLWYPAKLTGIFDTVESVYYSVVFTGYNEDETIWPKHLRAMVASSFESRPDAGAAGWLTRKCTHHHQGLLCTLGSVCSDCAMPACFIAGVRGTEVLRYCVLKDSVLTFYETDQMQRPRSSIVMKQVQGISPHHPTACVSTQGCLPQSNTYACDAGVGPCTAPNASSLEIELRMKISHVAPPTRLICGTRQDRRSWLGAMNALISPAEET